MSAHSALCISYTGIPTKAKEQEDSLGRLDGTFVDFLVFAQEAL
jgi:hypothetical protein